MNEKKLFREMNQLSNCLYPIRTQNHLYMNLNHGINKPAALARGGMNRETDRKAPGRSL